MPQGSNPLVCCSVALAKILLFFFNVVLFLLGGCCVGVGLWVRFSKNTLFNFVNLLDAKLVQSDSRDHIAAVANQNGLITIAAIILIVIGAVTLVVSFCGFYGILADSVIMIDIFTGAILLILIAQIVATVLVCLFQAQTLNTIEEGFNKLRSKFYVSLNEYVTKNTTAKAGITYFINWLQVTLECCDNASVGDSWHASNLSWAGQTLVNPVTCCRLASANDKSDAQKPAFDWNRINDKLKDKNCPYTEKSTSLHAKSCPKSLLKFIGSYSMAVMTAGVGFALSLLIVAIVSSCLSFALHTRSDSGGDTSI